MPSYWKKLQREHDRASQARGERLVRQAAAGSGPWQGWVANEQAKQARAGSMVRTPSGFVLRGDRRAQLGSWFGDPSGISLRGIPDKDVSAALFDLARQPRPWETRGGVDPTNPPAPLSNQDIADGVKQKLADRELGVTTVPQVKADRQLPQMFREKNGWSPSSDPVAKRLEQYAPLGHKLWRAATGWQDADTPLAERLFHAALAAGTLGVGGGVAARGGRAGLETLGGAMSVRGRGLAAPAAGAVRGARAQAGTRVAAAQERVAAPLARLVDRAENTVAARAARSRAARVADMVGSVPGVPQMGRASRAAWGLRRPVGMAGVASPVAVGAVRSGAQGSFDPLAQELSGQGFVGKLLDDRQGAGLADVPLNLVKDVLSFPAALIPSVYGAGSMIAGGQSGALWDAIKNESFLGNVAQGRFGRAGEVFKEHPGFSLAELGGVYGVSGRAAGAGVRAATGGQVGGTLRKPLLDPAATPAVYRRYSPNLWNQGVQRVLDARRQGQLGGQYARTGGGMFQHDELARAHKEMADRAVSTENILARQNRDETFRQIDELLPASRRGRKRSGQTKETQLMVPLITQGILRPGRALEDAESFLATIRKERATLEGADKLRASQVLEKQLQSIVDHLSDQRNVVSPAVDAERIAAQIAKSMNAREQQMIDAGLLTERQAALIRFTPYAVRHMGARNSSWDSKEMTRLAEVVARQKERVDELRHARANGDLSVTRTQMDDAIKVLEKNREAHRDLAEVATDLRLPNGERVTPARVQKHMRDNGVDPETVAFLTQRPRAAGRGDFYRPLDHRATLANESRTGMATLTGTFDASPDALRSQMMRSSTIAQQVAARDRITASTGIRETVGSYRAAKEMAANPQDAGLGNWPEGSLVVSRLTDRPGGTVEARTAANIYENMNPQTRSMPGELLHDLLGDVQRAPADETAAGQWVIQPKAFVDRVKQHTQPSKPLTRAIQPLSTAFKRTVLPTSTKWLAGQAADIWMRGAMAGAGPNDAKLARQFFDVIEKRHGPDVAAQARAMMVGGSHGSTVRENQVFRDAQQFADSGTVMRWMAGSARLARNAPAAKQVVDGYNQFANMVFKLNDVAFERPAQHAALGRELRKELRSFRGKFEDGVRVTQEAMNELADSVVSGKKLNLAKSIQLAKAVEEVQGQWRANGPMMRDLLVNYMPFGQWLRAATQYVFWTLPTKHPAKTGMIAALEQGMLDEGDVKNHTLFTQGEGLSSYLRGSLPPTQGGRRLATEPFTSFGFTGALAENVPGMLLGPFAGAFDALRGADFIGRDLQQGTGDGGTKKMDEWRRWPFALYAVGEAVVPFMRHIRQIREQGGSSVPGSTVFSPMSRNPQSFGAGFEKAFSPLKFYGSGTGNRKPAGPVVKRNTLNGGRTLKRNVLR